MQIRSILLHAKMVSKPASYPRPSTPVKVPDPVSPRETLLPLSRPPSQTPPHLPPRPALPPPPPGWTSTSHVVPAAYPRQFGASTGKLARESHPFRDTSATSSAGETSEGRRKRAAEETRLSLTARFDAGERVGENREDQPGLWMAVERWRREGGGEGLTLVLTHANGFTKEVRLSGTGL